MSNEDVTAPVAATESEMPFATKEQMLGMSGKRAYKVIDTPIGKMRLRTLVGTEAFEIDNYAYDSKGTYDRGREKYARAKRIVETVVDQQGNKVFSDFDLQAIVGWPEPLTNTLAAEILAMARPDSMGMFAKND